MKLDSNSKTVNWDDLKMFNLIRGHSKLTESTAELVLRRTLALGDSGKIYWENPDRAASRLDNLIQREAPNIPKIGRYSLPLQRAPCLTCQ
ncbi:hypothetical protein RRG08_009778 [Elysia crispata]|uniref:Uncharacterized protein n=1 Tax=Elysia crispata TaxID=231223 RepID=A0AAE0ZRW8_9GAST|nr:hypothetical protein RRG08_009778 [Elysia crispata]